ncbi:helix-turn-helix domain-containing protein [Hyphomonas sp.]|uniref:helix-turn-helix domain-containing protein n=1 Tax=Hyphomonas sp. TaxID=87 RepID=UPI00352790C8
MQFHADTAKIKRWREERHWSQEHLADLAGIGLRTIQRIEHGEKASRDTLTALAAAFNVDVMALTVDAQSEARAKEKQKIARGRAALRLSFWISFASYVFGMILFTGINITTGSYTMLPAMIWWTVGTAGHGLAVVLFELVARHKEMMSAAE